MKSKSKTLFYPELNASRLKSSNELDPSFAWQKPTQENKTGIPGFGINTKAMVSGFGFQARKKEDDARNVLRKESQKVENVRKGIVEAAENNTIGKIGKPSFFNKKTGETTDGYFAKDAKEGKIGLMDSILNKSESDLLIRKYGMVDTYGFGFAGAACNTHACALQRMGGAEVSKDFSFRRRVDGKQINLKEGDAPPTLPNNTDMDNIYPQIGYQHVALRDTKKSALSKGRFSSSADFDNNGVRTPGKTGVSREEAKKRYDQTVEGVDEILPGDNLRSNFYPQFFKDGSMDSGVGHSMTVGKRNPYEGGFDFYENSGQVLSGLRINNNVYQGGKEGIYLRYVGKTPELKKNLNTASFITKNTKKSIQPAGVKTTSGAKITANTKGINSLFKKLKKK